VLSFGHALMEKLVQPYKVITAHSWLVQVDADYFSLSTPERYALIDQLVGTTARAALNDGRLHTLPVLGIPGWWHAQDLAFYQDTQVFRPARQNKVEQAA
jgi:hypothetical protein